MRVTIVLLLTLIYLNTLGQSNRNSAWSETEDHLGVGTGIGGWTLSNRNALQIWDDRTVGSWRRTLVNAQMEYSGTNVSAYVTGQLGNVSSYSDSNAYGVRGRVTDLTTLNTSSSGRQLLQVAGLIW